MSDFTPFFVDRAKGGRASCKGCKVNCPSGELRLAKVVASPYGENQQMKSWHHVDCLMNVLLKQRPTTKRIDSIDDIGNWETLTKEDQEFLLKKINDMEKLYAEKNSGKYIAKVIKNVSPFHNNSNICSASTSSNIKVVDSPKQDKTEDDKFSMFFKLCKKIARVDAYTDKTATVNTFFRKGSENTFKGDLALWCKLLLPQVTKRVYNLKSKQLVKLFSKIFHTDHDDMLTHLEQGDVADTIQTFFPKSKTVKPTSESTLTIHEVEDFLEDLSKLTKEEEQIYHFKKIVKKCTLDDIKMLIRLIKGDLRINAGPKHILEGVHPDAYKVFQTSRDLNMVLDRVFSQSSGVKHKDASQSSVRAKVVLMTPVLPMLAEACKSVEMAMKKCPNGMFSEIKYDGERVQVHKKGNEFKYFSRALKPVMPHKVSHFKDYLPQAFPKGVDLILDAEVLMVDVKTGKPLPFGTLGIHKQSEFKDAQVCLFVFDVLYYNDKVLIDVPIRKRRQILLDNMIEVKNHVMISEQQLIEKPADLANMIAKVLQLGLEGLVLKDLESTYEPGKRHWLKVKKDYLFDGAMADTADLVVLGAWFGTGKKGGMMSVFLMGCLDARRNRWVTVTKVHTGHDDSTLDRLQKELGPLMVKISQEYSKVPSWLDCNKGMVPDYVALDPKKQPVWEITGTELTKANLHTADGISVRFPRVTRIRNDKDWETATNLEELKNLYKTSKEKTDVSLLNKLAATTSESYEPPKKKTKESPKQEKTKVRTLDSFLKKETTPAKLQTKIKDEANSSHSSETISEKSCNNSIDETDTTKRETKSTISKSKKPKIKDETNSSHSSDNVSENSNKSNIEERDKLKKDIKRTSNNSKKQEDLNSSHPSDTISEKSNKSSIDETDKPKKDIKRTSNNSKKQEHLNSSHSSDTISEKSYKRSFEETDKLKKHKQLTSKKLKKIDDEHSSSDTISENSCSNDETYVPDKEIKWQLLPENPLPDVFLDKRLGFYPDFISFSDEDRRHFERHWIAYGGIVVKAIRSMDVDYVVHNDDVIEFSKMQELKKKVPPNARHVTKDWLRMCISDVALCDTVNYAVNVKP